MKSMRLTFAAVSLVVFAAPAFAAGTPEVVHEGPVTVTKVQSPKKELRMEVLVPGARDAVWQAFTTTEGLNSWLWKDCAVDLRKGGSWIVNFPGGKTGGGTIEKFKRGSEIRMHAMAPEQFPTVRSVGTTAVFQFQAVGDTATMVRLVQTGWQKGEEWDNAYAYLAKGNAQLLAQLQRRFVNGPMNWEAAAGH
jgi:uncharacterized protein YndB with AHSA1/START domain